MPCTPKNCISIEPVPKYLLKSSGVVLVLVGNKNRYLLARLTSTSMWLLFSLKQPTGSWGRKGVLDCSFYASQDW